MSPERRVWVAQLPEMRLAYLERVAPSSGSETEDLDRFAALWDELNDWRVSTRPSLGRIDIASVGLWSEEGGHTTFRTAVPIRSDYEVVSPARTTFFPGGTFAYACADNVDEIEPVRALVRNWIQANKQQPTSGPIEVYRYHFNLSQHPCDCGYLVGEAPRASGGPIPIGR